MKKIIKFIKKLLHTYKVGYDVTDYIIFTKILEGKNEQKAAILTNDIFQDAVKSGCSDEQIKLIFNCIETYRDLFIR